MNKELKEYLYMLVGKELTYEDKEKILSYFNDLKQDNDRLKKKNKKQRKIISNAINHMAEDLYYMGYVNEERLLWILKGKENE